MIPMPRGFEIRNRFIEDAHRVDCGEVITRKMTPEEWQKYGPKANNTQGRDVMKTRIDYQAFLELAKVHGLEMEGREKIAQELGIRRVDVSYYVCRPDIKKKLKEAGLISTESESTDPPRTILQPRQKKAHTESESEPSPAEKPVTKEESKKNLVNAIAKELNVLTEQPKSIISSHIPNPKFEIHLNLCGELHEKYVSNASYNNSFSKSFDEFGVVSALIRMSDKWNFIKSLSHNGRSDFADGCLKNVLIDLANDCIMTVMEVMEQEKRILKILKEERA